MLRVQRYVNEIRKIIEKTNIYCREMGIIGKYLKINIGANIRNYLDMICDRRGFTKEELSIILKEFGEYLDNSLMDEYDDRINSLADENIVNISVTYDDAGDIEHY